MTCLSSSNVNHTGHFIDILHKDYKGFIEVQCWCAVIGGADDNSLEREQTPQHDIVQKNMLPKKNVSELERLDSCSSATVKALIMPV